MNFPILFRFTFLITGLAALALAGCASTLRPIASKPPVARIVFPAPFDISGWHAGLPPSKYSILLPAGEYHPLYEDEQYYYFQAPSKIVVNDPSSFLFDGGVTVPRGSTRPQGYYYVDQEGAPTLGQFKTSPPTR